MDVKLLKFGLVQESKTWEMKQNSTRGITRDKEHIKGFL